MTVSPITYREMGTNSPPKISKCRPRHFSAQCSFIFDPPLQIAQNYRINITSYTKGNALYGSIMVSKAYAQEIVKYCSRGPLSSFLDMQRDRFRPRRRIPFKLPHQGPPMDQIQRFVRHIPLFRATDRFWGTERARSRLSLRIL